MSTSYLPLATVLLMTAAMPATASAGVWLADLEVSEMTAERSDAEIEYTVTITNRVDDTARNPHARFFIPFGAEFVSTDHENCAASEDAGGQTGLVECFFDNLNRRDSLTFTVVTTLPEEHPYNISWERVDSTATVMVSSDTPDWDLSNNVASVDADSE